MEYGSSFSATLVEGSHAVINDSIMNLNHLHLSQQRARRCSSWSRTPACVAAAINFFVFRGRVRHPLKHRPWRRLARRIGMFDAAYGPIALLLRRAVRLRPHGRAARNLGRARGQRQHAAAIGRWLVARDGFDFLLYYLPDVDMAQHQRRARRGALDAVARADALDRQPGRRRRRARPVPRAPRASSCCADHGQTRGRARRATCGPRSPACACSSARCARRRATAQVAVAASNRVCMLYRLADAPARPRPRRRASGRSPGVDLAAFHEDGDVVVLRDGLELRFRRGGPAARPPGQRAGR